MSEFDQINTASNEDELLNSFDLEKFLFILRKSILWMLLFVAVAGSLAYLYVRYTKPIYESTSLLKLDFESEATTLGLTSGVKSFENELSGEIELLKSKLFYSKVVDAVDMDVSYHYYGRYLTDERYGNSPFAVSHKVKNGTFYDKPIDLEILDESSFRLIYYMGETEVSNTYKFGEPIVKEDYNLLIEKTHHFRLPEVKGTYFFTINSREAQIGYFQRNVNVRPENFNARTILISLADHNRYKAQDLLTAIDTLYLEYTKQAKNLALEQKIKFLNTQIDVTEERLEGFEDYFEDFIVENRTLSLENDLQQSLVRLEYLDSAKIRLELRLEALESLERQFENADTIIINSAFSPIPSSLNEYLKEYQELLSERKEKLYSYNENTFIIRRLDARLEILRNTIQSVIPEQEKYFRGRLLELQQQSAKLEQNFVELPSMITAYDKNQRFYSLQENYLMSLWKSKMDLEITKAGTVTNFVILAPASSPGTPIKPQPKLIYGVALSIGLILSVGFLLIRYLLHNNITSLRELERLVSVPILGTVPHYSAEKLPLTKLVIKPSSKSAISEALRTIRTNMEFLNGRNDTQVLTITSTISGEGKTFIAVNLGAIIAFSKQKVCIVDMDMRKPKVHLAFGDEPHARGMSTLLIGKNSLDECIIKTEIENLDYIPAGPNPPNPSELVLNQEYDEILTALKSQYDLIILDTPPVGLVTDAVLSMKKSDLQLYAVRSDYSKRSFIKSIENLKKINQFKNLTVIFNGVKAGGKGYGHGYGYGYGYGYYEDSK